MPMLASALYTPGCACIKSRCSTSTPLNRVKSNDRKASVLAAVPGKGRVMCGEAGPGRDPLMARLYKAQSEYNGEVEVLEVF